MPKIIPLFSDQETIASERLARYWDAHLRGQPGDALGLDPELVATVQLLEHYREMTLPPDTAPVLASPAAAPTQRRLRHVVALVALATLLLFASNTLLSPRSWLLNPAADPDWIPWVSDDWLGPRALTAQPLLTNSSEAVNHNGATYRGA